MSIPADGLVADLGPVLAALGVVAVESVVQLSGGASRDTYSIEVVAEPDPGVGTGDGDAGGRRRRLVLQVAREGSERSMLQEAAVLRQARAAGVPVAEVLAAADDTARLGAPFLVLAHVEGETIARRILRDDAFRGARAALPAQLGRALGRLHRVDPQAVPGLEPVDPLVRYREVLDGLGRPHPTFELAFRWLDRTRPPAPRRQVVVHGDARLGNLIVDGAGLAALIDWELAHLGDPLEDLGWLCTKAWRFGGSHPVGGFGDYAELLDAYAEAAGEVVDLDALHWWEAVGSLTWGIICIVQADTHLSGLRRSHELAALGRRVCENEHDLLSAMPDVWPAGR